MHKEQLYAQTEKKLLKEYKERRIFFNTLSREQRIELIRHVMGKTYNPDNETKAFGDRWNTIQQYDPLFQILIPYAAQNSHASFLKAMKQYRNPEDIGKRIKNEQWYKGLTIAEIGGVITKLFFEQGGARVHAVDAGR